MTFTSSRRRSRTSLSKAAVGLMAFLLIGGCVFASDPFTTPPPARLSSLEALVQQDSTDVDAVTRLAAGYFSGGRPGDAYDLLEPVNRRLPTEPTILAMLGLVEHELGRFDRAAARYRAFLQTNDGPLAERIGVRLEAIRSEALDMEVRTILAQEDPRPGTGSSVGEESPAELDPRKVVVMPFSHDGGAELDLEALDAALTWLVGRDLAVPPVRVADRYRVRSLIEEMGVEPSRRDDLSLGIRVARLLGAGHVIQGSLRSSNSGEISWDLVVLSPGTGGRVALAPVSVEGEIGDVLRMEGRVLELLRRSVEGEAFLPAPGERREVGPPSDVEALLTFGRGLRALDAGEYESARAVFEDARRLDSGFGEAAELARHAARVEASLDVPLVTTLEEVGRVGELQRAVLGLRRSPGSARRRALDRVGADEREVVSEVLGLDRIRGGAFLDIVFTLPAGGAP